MAAGGEFRPVTEADLRRFTDASSFGNGKSYHRAGYISRTTLRGALVSGLCQGSSGGPYRVEAELVPHHAPGREQIVGWGCTCPRGGFCKHIVALLLTWIATPDRFASRREVAELLAEKSREELLSLLTDILERQPELIDYVEAALPVPTPVAATGQGTRPTLDRAQIAEQVRQAFAESDDDYDDGSRYGRYDNWQEGRTADVAVLTRLRRSADDYAAAGRWADAQLVYAAIVEEATSHDDEAYYEEEGEVLRVVEDCVAGLVRCLEAQVGLSPGDRLAPNAREELLRSLYDAWSYGLDYSLRQADAVPDLIIQHATKEERATVEGWLRGALGPGGTYGRPDVRREFVEFLLALREAGGADDETILEEYRAAGLWDDVARRLLLLGRTGEALATARQWLSDTREALTFADSLLALGGEHIDEALAFIEEQLRAVGDRPNQDYGVRDGDAYLTWLGHQYGLHGRPERALEMAWRRFHASSNDQTYAAVQTAASLPGLPAELWPTKRRKLLLALEEKGLWGVLVNIFLKEGEVGEALTALGELEQRPSYAAAGYYGYWNLGDYRLRVARAAEDDFPERAIGIYQRVAQHHIDQRDRKNYQQAAEYLDRARGLYERQGRYEAWGEFIRDLRDRHRTLRALREELNARELE
jgi:uncharacterized Zn finger protein